MDQSPTSRFYDRRANHKQPIFLAVVDRLHNSVLEESHRRNQTSTSEDLTPQNWAYSSKKGRHTERRRVTTIFHPPAKFTEAVASSDIQKYKAHCGEKPAIIFAFRKLLRQRMPKSIRVPIQHHQPTIARDKTPYCRESV
jgi:hypothetical protein